MINRQLVVNTAGTILLVAFLGFVFLGLADKAAAQKETLLSFRYPQITNPVYLEDLHPNAMSITEEGFWRHLDLAMKLSIKKVEWDTLDFVLDSYRIREREDGYHVFFIVVPDIVGAQPGYLYLVDRDAGVMSYIPRLETILQDSAKAFGVTMPIRLHLGDWVSYNLGDRSMCLRSTALPDQSLVNMDSSLPEFEDIIPVLLEARDTRPKFARVTFRIEKGEMIQDRRQEKWSMFYRVVGSVVGTRPNERQEVVIARFYLGVPYDGQYVRYGQSNWYNEPTYYFNVKERIVETLAEYDLLPNCADGLCTMGNLSGNMELERLDDWKESIPVSRLDIAFIPPEECGE